MSTLPRTCAALTEQMIKLKTRTDRLSDVKSLNLWGQDLGDISLLTQLPAVEVLSLSVNSISSLKDFSSCLKLQELYLRKNEIADVSEVSYLARLPDLRVLWLSDNPCAQDPNYRAKVLQVLPHLTKLDNDDVEAPQMTAQTTPLGTASTPAAEPIQAMSAADLKCMQTQDTAPSTSVSPAAAPAAERLPASEQPSFHPNSVAFIEPAQLPTAVATNSTPPVPSASSGRSNILYAVIALLAELDDSSLHIVQAEVMLIDARAICCAEDKQRQPGALMQVQQRLHSKQAQ